MQIDLREQLRAHMLAQEPQVWSRTVRDGAGDTIFGIDAAIEELLLQRCAEWGKEQHFTLLAAGLDPAGDVFGKPGRRGPPFWQLPDPTVGTLGSISTMR